MTNISRDTKSDTDVMITGIGLVSSIAADTTAHEKAVFNQSEPDLHLSDAFAPYIVHKLQELDWSSQIPKRGDLRQMEGWQKIGTYAAGLALQDADLKEQSELLHNTHMIVCSGGGERDYQADEKILNEYLSNNDDDKGAFLNERLMSELRPTLFLAQLSNLLAGNISIVHGVLGSSRTFMGEEPSATQALKTAISRIKSGTIDLCLVGGSYNAERADIILQYVFKNLLGKSSSPIFDRINEDNAGMNLGSMGAFLLLESRRHCEKRGKKPYARLDKLLDTNANRSKADRTNAALNMWRAMDLSQTTPVLSLASGATQATAAEYDFLSQTGSAYICPTQYLGHGMEAALPFGVGLSALALRYNQLPFSSKTMSENSNIDLNNIAISSFGHWFGESLLTLDANI